MARRECPYCGSDERPEYVSRVSLVGWSVVVLCAVSCILLPLCWVGLFITEEQIQCSDCGARLDGCRGIDNSRLARSVRRRNIGL